MTRRSAVGLLCFWLLVAVPETASASFLSPEMEDKVATVLAVFILFFVPIVLIVLFWMVHILPEKIAHKRHHPQLDAIRTLCLLSLVFGGLLWPLAWIWAYTKPVLHKLAYGTDRAPHTADEAASVYEAEAAVVEPEESNVIALQERLARLKSRHIPTADLNVLQADLDAIEAKYAVGGRR